MSLCHASFLLERYVEQPQPPSATDLDTVSAVVAASAPVSPVKPFAMMSTKRFTCFLPEPKLPEALRFVSSLIAFVSATS